MKNIKKWLLLCICLIAVGMFGGCKKLEPMSIDTQLNINSQFDGERVMTMTMPKVLLDQLFKGDTGLLRETIEKYCPADMGCSIETGSADVTIKLVIPFASLSEYQAKVQRILQADSNPNKDQVNPSIYYDVSSTMFKNGYALEESFKSVEMFYWLTEAVKTEFPEVNDEDLSNLYVEGKNVLIYNGAEIETGAYIKHTEMKSTSFKEVHVTTDVNEKDHSYKTFVELVIDRADYDELKTGDLDELMELKAPTNVVLSTSMSKTERTYRYSFTASNESQYVTYMNSIFNASNSVFKVEEEQMKDEALKARKYITLYVDGGYYVDFSREDAEMTYTFNVDNSYRMDTVKGKYNYLKRTDFNYSDTNSSVLVSMDAADEVVVSLGTDVALQKVDVETIIHNPHQLERQIRFYLSEEKEKLVGESLTKRIKERLNSSIKFEKNDNHMDNAEYLVTITAESAEDLAKLTCGFLDGDDSSGTSVMSGGISEKRSLKKINFGYNDKIDFTQFLNGSDVIDGIHYIFSYPSGYTAAFSDSAEYEDVSEKGNTLTCVTRNKSLSIESHAQKTNVNGILQLVLFYLSLVVMLILILLNLPTMIRCIKTRHINWEDTGLFTHKGYVTVTIFAIATVIFVITLIRLIFKVY